MRSGRTGVVITVAVVAYGLGMAFVAAAIATAGDSTALGMLFLFGPRWMLLGPWIPLLPLAVLASRRTVLFALAGTAVTLLFVSGFEVPVPNAPWRGAEHAPSLRVVTYNTDGSMALASRIVADLIDWDADVVVLQSCSPEVGIVLQRVARVRSVPHSYEIHRDDEFCVVSRLPLRRLVRKAPERGSREEGRALRFSFIWNGTPVSMGAVHLPSPRDALAAARRGNPTLLDGSIRVRYRASRSTATWIHDRRASTAEVVVGDFNLPAESRALRKDWGALRNAFSEVGWGFGHTMFAGRHQVRIDHVLVSDAVSVRKVTVLSGYPSEHQPVVADLGVAPKTGNVGALP